MFTTKKQLGYILRGFFYDAKTQDGSVSDSFKYLEENPNTVDEIYCAIDELTEGQINKFVKYANLNNCNIKFIPSSKKLLTKRLKADYYGYLPVLSIQKVALNDEFNKLVKRTFDVMFSLFIIVFILSWLTVVLYILIKLESRGPLFFKHKRNGINYKEFNCYKYRSLRQVEDKGRDYVTKDDERVTKIGRFIRKTSIDELPQFYNVLKGDMSVVGPRPHMLFYTDDYSKKVDIYNFIFRHNVKPGITGLAQVSGFRGEVETDKDIIGRVKYDIFYIENWSLLLDIKIIIQTFIRSIKGDDKAY
jgi:putative colanic acid biosynthesis UDP-glucose lipid carrier transferase